MNRSVPADPEPPQVGDLSPAPALPAPDTGRSPHRSGRVPGKGTDTDVSTGPGTGVAAEGGRRSDVAAAATGVVLIGAACLIGAAIERSDATLHVPWPPLQAFWLPHWGPGTPAAAVVGAACVGYGPRLAARLPWRPLLLATWAAAMAWTWSLALVDGWQRGVAGRLTTTFEYLSQLDRFAHVHATLRDFTHHILETQPHPWTTHVAGHPPGATLTFVALDRLGLGGGAWASAWCITAGASAAVAVLVAVRALGDEATARRAAPFMVPAPAAVWIGASADGYFAAVAAWALALLALAATRAVRAPGAAALGAGLLLGLAAYLSYGLVITAVGAAAVLALARTARPLPAALIGAGAVAAAFTVSGFSWWQAYPLLVERYYEGVGGVRPYGYWVWADLACAAFSAGLAAVAGARRALAAAPSAAARLRTGTPSGPQAVAVLAAVALLMMLIADLSGLSKAETERIWLPFIVWLLPASALLPAVDHRRWLLLQAVLALLVNHLLLTNW
ncbi:hypothetical protein [Streptomyces sp. NPDC049040]|uniref:hypothetical protein n=1 Tax=Streptomyces sp. NPDC049040 TaxID=3365593 RepID=UPI00372092B9